MAAGSAEARPILPNIPDAERPAKAHARTTAMIVFVPKRLLNKLLILSNISVPP
jgi:hypothetical protein